MSDSEEDISLTQSSFNGSINSGNDLENLLGDYENAQFSIEEATEGLFSFNQADKYEEVSIGSVDKEVETNEKKTSKRDIIVIDDKELLARNSERIPKNTKKVTFWCLNVWNEWATERNALAQNSADLLTQVPSAELLHTICDFELCFWLSKFVYEVRKKGGELHPPKTLYEMCVGIQRHLRDNGLAGLEIFKSPDYKLFQDAIDSEMKRLTRKGVGVATKQAEPITPHEEEIKWEKGVLGNQDPKTLLHTLVFLFGKFSALRSGEEHRSLTFEQLSVVEGDHIERTRLQYRSHGEKNHGGRLKQRNVTPKVVEQHEHVDKPERCVVRL